MMYKLSEIEMSQAFRQYATYKEFVIVFRWQWDIELTPLFRQELDIWNIYSKAM
jgi:hypothetical protein